MTEGSDRHVLFRSLADIAACIVAISGFAVLAGWLFDIGILRFDSPHMVRMKANAAFAFILSGVSLWLAGREAGSRWNRRVSQAIAFLVALIGLLTLCEYLFGWDLGIDQLLASEAPGAVRTSSPGRIAPNAALNFFLLGTSLLLHPARRCEWIVSFLALGAGTVSLLALMGYAYATEALIGVAAYTPIALNTALTFLVLSLGVLFSLQRRGLMAILSGDGPGSVIARRLLPPVIVIPFALGWMRLRAQRLGLFGTEFGVAILVSFTILILTVVVWKAAVVLNRTEAARKEAEEALERRSEELARSNADLERFAYVASHDLQEPLRMVSSYVQLLARRYQGKLDSDADEFIGFAVDGAGRMQRLITDLLAFSRVGRQGKEFEPTSLETALDRALSNLKMAIEESGTIVTHDPMPVVQGDPTQLVQVFQNLVGNAIKFRGKEPPRVDVSIRRNGGDWQLAVRDNGIGVDGQYAERIFIIFQRLHGREYPGTGIGLPISRKIVERHGGRMWVESAPGKGSTFYFTLPRLRDRDPAGAPKVSSSRA